MCFQFSETMKTLEGCRELASVNRHGHPRTCDVERENNWSFLIQKKVKARHLPRSVNNMSQYDNFGKMLVEAGGNLIKVIRRNIILLLGSAGLVAFVMVGWSTYCSYRTLDVVVLGGPPGGSGETRAREIAQYLQDVGADSPFGRRYRARVENTGGYSANFNRIESDRSGTIIGFGHDGYEKGKHVRTLLPYDKQFLHVICRREFYDKFKKLKGSPTLSDIKTALKTSEREHEHNVYLGPIGSGTKWTAEKVLERYGINPEAFSSNGIANWMELNAALNRGDIDVGFVLGPRNAESVARIAASGECILLSIDQADAICQFNKQLVPESFAEHSYSPDFCHGQLRTVTAKRVVVCSDLLGTTDAYHLAEHLSSALNLSRIAWPQHEDSEQGYNLHVGSRLLQEKKEPEWLESLRFIWITFGVWIVLSVASELARRISKWLNSGSESALKPATSKDSVTPALKPRNEKEAQFEKEIDATFDRLKELPESIPRRDFDKWKREIKSILAKIDAARQDNQLDDKSHKSLRSGIRELFGELLLFHRSSRSNRKKTEKEPKTTKSPDTVSVSSSTQHT